MKLSEFFSEYELHDSVVLRIDYLPMEERLLIFIDLCNYMQRTYQEGEPELIPGQLEFRGVRNFTLDPPLDTIDWDNMSGGISSSGHVPEWDQELRQAAEFLIHLSNYKTRDITLYILRFLCEDVNWKPLAAAPSGNSSSSMTT